MDTDFGLKGNTQQTSKFVRLPPSDDEQDLVEEDADDFLNKIKQKKDELNQAKDSHQGAKVDDDGEEDSDEDDENRSFDFKMNNMRTASTKATNQQTQGKQAKQAKNQAPITFKKFQSQGSHQNVLRNQMRQRVQEDFQEEFEEVGNKKKSAVNLNADSDSDDAMPKSL